MTMRRKITIGWDGDDYELIVTMDVIDRLEEHVNLAQMNRRTAMGDIRFSHSAKLIALILREAGALVTPDDVYESLYNGGSIEPTDLIPILNSIYEVVFPEPEKKSKPTETTKAA